MSWVQVLTIVLANVGLCVTLFLWLRKESNADRKEFAAGIAETRKEAADFKKMWTAESKEFYANWAKETKEFHGRLCIIEEKARK